MMDPKENNLDKNISRLVKLTGEPDGPSKAFVDSLTNEALGKIKKTGSGSFFARKAGWLSAAAVLMVGIFITAAQLADHREKAVEFAKDTAYQKKAEAGRLEQKYRPAGLEKYNAPAETLLSKADKIDSQAAGKPAVSAPVMLAEDTAKERPPFAPASAIELVTLPRRENVQLTIYNSADLTLVREKRNLTLKKGWNWLQFMWANTLIDPTSLDFKPLADTDKVEIQQLVFPPRLREIGRWLVRSQIEGQVPFEITYFTSGLSWRAFYMGTLSEDEQKMDLQGFVRAENRSGEDYEDAQTRLIVGQVHILDRIITLAKRQYPYDSPIIDYGTISSGEGLGGSRLLEMPRKDKMLRMDLDRKAGDYLDLLEQKQIAKEGLSEYFLYTIEGTETIPEGWGKRLPSFAAKDIPVKSLYKYDEDRWGRQTSRFILFANDKDHKLGETPVPDGHVKIYGRTGEQGHLVYTGGTDIKYIPVGEKAELGLGQGRDCLIEPVMMDTKTGNFTFDKNGNITGWNEIQTWKIDVANTRRLPADVEITRGFGTAYWKISLEDRETAYKKHDVTHARFTMTLPPQTKRAVKYTITTYHGEREAAWKE